MAAQARRTRMRHRRLGDAPDVNSEFVAPYDTSSLFSGDTYNPGRSGAAANDSDTATLLYQPVSDSGAVSVEDLQQQTKAGLFSNPQVPSQYNVAPNTFGDTQIVFGPESQAAQVAAGKAFAMWNGGGSATPAVATSAPTTLAIAPAAAVTQPASSSVATPATAPVASTDWLSNLLTWLQSPVSSTITLPWYLLLLTAGAALYLMREE